MSTKARATFVLERKSEVRKSSCRASLLGVDVARRISWKQNRRFSYWVLILLLVSSLSLRFLDNRLSERSLLSGCSKGVSKTEEIRNSRFSRLLYGFLKRLFLCKLLVGPGCRLFLVWTDRVNAGIGISLLHFLGRLLRDLLLFIHFLNGLLQAFDFAKQLLNSSLLIGESLVRSELSLFDGLELPSHQLFSLEEPVKYNLHVGFCISGCV